MTQKCRSCNSDNTVEFLSVNNRILDHQFSIDESSHRQNLDLYFCEHCHLVSLSDPVSNDDLFNENYNFFSSGDEKVLDTSQNFADEIVSKLGLNHQSFVVEIGSNDGYLLAHFKRKSIPAVGFEPSTAPAKIANDRRLETINEFFGVDQAWGFLAETHPLSKGRKADLIIANDVIDCVRDLDDVLEGTALILKESGVAVFTSPWINFIFDDDAKENFNLERCNYFSTHSMEKACSNHDLVVTDVQRIDTLNGPHLRWTIKHEGMHIVSPNVTEMLGLEIQAGLTNSNTFIEFSKRIRQLESD